MEQANEDMPNVNILLQDLREATGKETKKETLKRLVKYDQGLFSPQDIELVAKFLLDEAPSVRARAAAVLGHCKSHIHLDALITLTKDKDDNVAQAAALALGEIGDPRAGDAIKDVLTRLEISVDHVYDRKSHQRLIEPRIYPSDPTRTMLTFAWRDRLGHDKAEARADRAISEASEKLEPVRQALRKCSNSEDLAKKRM